MVRKKIKYLYLPLLLLSCTHETKKPYGDYPSEIGNIILNRCATSGCHNQTSYAGAGGLNLSTWDDLFNGGYGGAAVIPYRPDFSTLCYYTNTDSSLGITLSPTMPEAGAPLSKNDYLILAGWIASGAPKANKQVAFTGNPKRKKMYVINRLCDVVTVIDETTFLQMRYIDVGNKSAPEFPQCILVAPDKQYWYTSFFATSSIIQQFDAVTDRHVADIQLGNGSWHSFAITGDSRYGYFADNSHAGRIVYADIIKNTLLANYDMNGGMRYPLGMALNEQAHKLYCGTNTGNFIYSIDISNPSDAKIKQVAIDGTGIVLTNSSLDPTILQSGEDNLCYIACQKTHDIRVVDMSNDQMIATIPLRAPAQAMTYSPALNRLFIACPDDTLSFPGNRGSIVVLDAQNHSIIKYINSGYEPYSITLDDENGIAIVTNANLHISGPAPHHVSKCGGRNGSVSFINIHTLELTGKKSEVAVFPYGTAIR